MVEKTATGNKRCIFVSLPLPSDLVCDGRVREGVAGRFRPPLHGSFRE